MQNVLVIVTDSPGRKLTGESSGEWTCWGREASKIKLRANLEIVTINTSFPISGSSAAGMLVQNVPNWSKEPCLIICMLTGTRDQIANICWIIKKARKFQKNIYFCLIDYAKAFDCVDHNKLWKILKVMGIPDHLTCLLRNLYASQEATVSTGRGTTDGFQIGKGVCQGCILSPC